MKFKILVIEIFCLFLVFKVQGQEWIKLFQGDTNFLGYRVYEHYDKGYLITGDKEKIESHRYGWLFKTDINGNRLWEKSVGDSDISTQFSSLAVFENSDITLIGGTSINGYHDPLIMKIDACGEKKWCKRYDAVSQYGWGQDIVALPEGGYIALFENWVEAEENKPVWLFRLDEEGEIIWQQYFPQDSIFWGSGAYDLDYSNDNTIIITGESYTPDTISPNPIYLRPMIVKVDLDGNAVFELSWGREIDFLGNGTTSVFDNNGNIYTAIRHIRSSPPFGDSPCLMKTSPEGIPLFYNDLIDSSDLGISTAMNWFHDSTLILNGVWIRNYPEDTAFNSVFKTNTAGDIILQKELFMSVHGFMDCISTYDNKAVLVGPFGFTPPYWQTMMIKLNSDLEYDSVYTRPFTYDSLCPHPIASDTISLSDCEVVVSIDEPLQNPETTRLHVYPNPAGEKITIEMPKYLVRKTGNHGLTATTIYHQWKETRLEVFDLFGKLMYCKAVPLQEKSVELNLSAWPRGMYLTRLVFMNEVVAQARFVAGR